MNTQFCQAVRRPKILVCGVSGPANRRFASIPVSASGLSEARSSQAMRISSSQSRSSGANVTSRSLIALIEPGSCFAGSLLELALAADRSFQLAGVFEEVDPDADPATITVGPMNLGPLPMSNGLTRLQTRYLGDEPGLAAVEKRAGEALEAEDAEQAGLVTFAPDDIDWDEEVRIAVEERASFSPDALTGLEANYRFPGPETLETKIFGRLTAWQNWIFYRPNASGPDGALRRFGTGQRADFDRKRV